MEKIEDRNLCAVIGDINIDIITPPFEFPEEIGESSIVLENFNMSLGGNAANFATELAALGLPHHFFGTIGDCAISNWIKQKLNEFNVSFSLFEIKNKTAGITFAMTFKNGKRQFVATLGTNNLFSYHHIEKDKLLQASHLYRAGFWYTPKLMGQPTISLMKLMIQNNKITSLDVGWDPDNFPSEKIEILYKTLDYTNIFFANEKEIKMIANKNDLNQALEFLLELATNIDKPIIVLHQGSKGSLIATKTQKIKIPTKKVAQINPTGTGDIYNAAFIYGVMHNWSLEKAGKFADAAACVHLSDPTKIYPNLEQIYNYLSKN
ncbi:MAG: carbohydrate kinase family protein [Candidatus Helarchaeota archaeon]